MSTNPKLKRKPRGHAYGIIRLSGTVNGVEYRLGVSNPFNHRNPARLNGRHLLPLRTLLGFVDPTRLETRLAISETEFNRRCSEEHAWSLLVDILTCWIRITNASATIDSHFASVSFEKCTDRSERTAFVTFSEDVIPIIKGMLKTSAQTH